MARIELFPLCDHTNVLTNALLADDAEVSARPDALIFAWLVSLPKGVYAQRAASAVILVAKSRSRQYSVDQRALLRELTDIAAGTPTISNTRDVQLEASWRRITSSRRQHKFPSDTPS